MHDHGELHPRRFTLVWEGFHILGGVSADELMGLLWVGFDAATLWVEPDGRVQKFDLRLEVEALNPLHTDRASRAVIHRLLREPSMWDLKGVAWPTDLSEPPGPCYSCGEWTGLPVDDWE